ncbi:MAG: peptide deformylase [Spirochaetia bacterium]|nr:peptide deformylase [Spirochaetota bacterium]MCX8096180.1 peptide deformylase [Spirochaetota bacterium]MDW8111734.1 peptide deformylase [Spirochaetia bacterium]
MILEVIKFPDSRLKMLSKEVKFDEENEEEIQNFIDNLIETMYNAPGGIGISSPQVGVHKRIIVVDARPNKKTTVSHGLVVMINPVIVYSEGNIIVREGCMSIPDYTGNVERKEKIVVKGFDRNFKEIQIETEGMEAVVFQHEIDHLDGILFIDRIKDPQTDLFRRKKYL